MSKHDRENPFERRVREAMKAKGLTLWELAVELGVGPPEKAATYGSSNMTKKLKGYGAKSLNPEQIVRLAELLGIPLAELVRLQIEARPERLNALSALVPHEERAALLLRHLEAAEGRTSEAPPKTGPAPKGKGKAKRR